MLKEEQSVWHMVMGGEDTGTERERIPGRKMICRRPGKLFWLGLYKTHVTKTNRTGQ